MNNEQTPAASGFRMPAEWQPHSATWLAWPHNDDTWPTNLAEAQSEFLGLAKTIAKDEPVIVIAPDDQAEILTHGILSTGFNGLRIWTSNTPTNDAWIRDYGPTFVTSDDNIMAIDWQYNAWGGKYPPFEDDQKVAAAACKQMPPHVHHSVEIPLHRSDLCIEGGALEVDGDGLLLCTYSCAMDANRNPGWTVKSVEREFQACLGINRTIWLSGNAIAGDDTDGHIDQLARFVPGQKILYAWTDDLRDPQRKQLEKNLLELTTATERLEKNFDLIALPLPEPVDYKGNRLPASYCNFYLTTHSVIVPQFNQPKADGNAIGILAGLFPNRKIVGLPSLNLNVGLGSFHCLTLQQPLIDRRI